MKNARLIGALGAAMLCTGLYRSPLSEALQQTPPREVPSYTTANLILFLKYQNMVHDPSGQLNTTKLSIQVRGSDLEHFHTDWKNAQEGTLAVRGWVDGANAPEVINVPLDSILYIAENPVDWNKGK